MAFLLLVLCAPALAQLPAPGQPGAIDDPRYCGEPARNADGVIKRNRAVLREFARVFPCPATLQPVPSCPGWAIDHTIPLASGGCDAIPNLTWLPDAIKRCADSACKDRWERRYHAHPRAPVNP
ncbi:MAG TPA: HNH endonuclease signature motif containing protein [Ramlibacter sp.]|nr:HNH endonuclease signature motif containing protein [Ramlibacter sp.]